MFHKTRDQLKANTYFHVSDVAYNSPLICEIWNKAYKIYKANKLLEKYRIQQYCNLKTSYIWNCPKYQMLFFEWFLSKISGSWKWFVEKLWLYYQRRYLFQKVEAVTLNSCYQSLRDCLATITKSDSCRSSEGLIHKRFFKFNIN